MNQHDIQATNNQVQILIEALEDSKSVKAREWRETFNDNRAAYRKWLEEISVMQSHLKLISLHSGEDRTIMSQIPVIFYS